MKRHILLLQLPPFFFCRGGSVDAAEAWGQKQIWPLEAGNVCQDVGIAYPDERKFDTLTLTQKTFFFFFPHTRAHIHA